LVKHMSQRVVSESVSDEDTAAAAEAVNHITCSEAIALIGRAYRSLSKSKTLTGTGPPSFPSPPSARSLEASSLSSCMRREGDYTFFCRNTKKKKVTDLSISNGDHIGGNIGS
ncbi:unnamed protein product, partial [Sphenostylis stenocarpa]